VDPLAESLAAKIDEQISRTLHLIGTIPPDRVAWVPPIPGAWSIAQLLGHLFDCLGGVCAVLYAAYPTELAQFPALQTLPVNLAATPQEAALRIALYRAHIVQGFTVLRDDDLAGKMPTVFVEDGESMLTLLLGNLEHLVSHKYQLFTYLKLAGVSVGTPDLYQFR
jgi:hypothetical protein